MSLLTVLEANFADHDPTCCVEQLDSDERADLVRHRHVDVARVVDGSVWRRAVHDGRVGVVLARNAEVEARLAEDADVLLEIIVRVDGHAAEVADRVEGEGEGDWLC